jgi:DNA-3-methyladenine glycosylase
MPAGNAGCVLLRALEPVLGVRTMAEARHVPIVAAPTLAQRRLISSGPGRLSQALGITRARDNGKDLTGMGSDLWFADDSYLVAQVRTTPRIGVTKAADRPLRFIITGNPFVSGTRVL